MADRLRIFVTTSHVSCVYMTIHARRTHQATDTDVLLIDVGTRRKEVLDEMMATATMHNWKIAHSFSTTVHAAHDFEPSLRKKLTRKWKEAPLLRPLYTWLLARYERQRDERLSSKLKKIIPTLCSVSSVQVFGHTQTLANKLIVRIHPLAEQFFFEHGLGDYHYILEKGRLQGPMFAVFAQRFRGFLMRRGIPTEGIQDLDLASDLPALAADLLARLPGHRSGTVLVNRPIVFVLLETVDMYEVPPSFWGAYLDHILQALKNFKRFHFILKPHPAASRSSLEATIEHCRVRDLSFTLLDQNWQKSVAAEVLFAEFAPRTQHVFCLFSSACFYLSQLYRAPHITYHYSTEFMDRWTGNAPPMYKRHFEALKPLIKEVFAERCLPY